MLVIHHTYARTGDIHVESCRPTTMAGRSFPIMLGLLLTPTIILLNMLDPKKESELRPAGVDFLVEVFCPRFLGLLGVNGGFERLPMCDPLISVLGL